MKQRVFYKSEQLSFGAIFMFGLPLFMTAVILYEQIISSSDWTSSGFLIAICIILFFDVLTFWLLHSEYNRIKSIRLEHELIALNGMRFDGEIIDTRTNVYRDRDSKGYDRKTFSYYVCVKYNVENRDITYWTPELVFDPKRLSSNKVDVYVYNDVIYVSGFEI